jgi:hypothetical protein
MRFGVLRGERRKERTRTQRRESVSDCLDGWPNVLTLVAVIAQSCLYYLILCFAPEVNLLSLYP